MYSFRLTLVDNSEIFADDIEIIGDYLRVQVINQGGKNIAIRDIMAIDFCMSAANLISGFSSKIISLPRWRTIGGKIVKE